jgi:hypothetical protein
LDAYKISPVLALKDTGGFDNNGCVALYPGKYCTVSQDAGPILGVMS